MSEQRAIVEMVSEAKPGAVFVPSDFAEAGYTMKEAQIENLVTAKGYTDCVAFMGEDSISVVVDTGTGELTAEDVAKITDIAMTETGYPASGIKIMASN